MEPKVFSCGRARPGRGFSYPELKKADVDLRLARRLGLRVDKRRRAAYENNIEFLKKQADIEKKRLEKLAKKKAKKKAGKGKAKTSSKKTGTTKSKSKKETKTEKETE